MQATFIWDPHNSADNGWIVRGPAREGKMWYNEYYFGDGFLLQNMRTLRVSQRKLPKFIHLFILVLKPTVSFFYFHSQEQ